MSSFDTESASPANRSGSSGTHPSWGNDTAAWLDAIGRAADIPIVVEGDPDVPDWFIVSKAADVAEAALLNMQQGVPDLFESDVRYQLTPIGCNAPRTALETQALGSGDCQALSAWRIAERWTREGAPPSIRFTAGGPNMLHVSLGDEDPSAALLSAGRYLPGRRNVCELEAGVVPIPAIAALITTAVQLIGAGVGAAAKGKRPGAPPPPKRNTPKDLNRRPLSDEEWAAYQAEVRSYGSEPWRAPRLNDYTARLNAELRRKGALLPGWDFVIPGRRALVGTGVNTSGAHPNSPAAAALSGAVSSPPPAAPPAGFWPAAPGAPPPAAPGFGADPLAALQGVPGMPDLSAITNMLTGPELQQLSAQVGPLLAQMETLIPQAGAFSAADFSAIMDMASAIMGAVVPVISAAASGPGGHASSAATQVASGLLSAVQRIVGQLLTSRVGAAAAPAAGAVDGRRDPTRLHPALQELLRRGTAAGLSTFLNSGHRTVDQQIGIWRGRIKTSRKNPRGFRVPPTWEEFERDPAPYWRWVRATSRGEAGNGPYLALPGLSKHQAKEAADIGSRKATPAERAAELDQLAALGSDIVHRPVPGENWHFEPL